MNAYWIEQVEAYLEDKISKKDLQVIAEREGVQNVDQEIKWLRDSRLAIEAVGLKEQLNEILPKADPTKAKVRNLRVVRSVIGIAAALLVLIIAFFAINNNSQPELYAQYEYVDPGLPVLMSQSEDYLFYDAMTYYGEGNYAVAAEKLEGLLATSPESDTIAYYLGASQLYLNNAPEAIAALDKVVTNTESVFQQRAQWLRVLSALKMENRSDAEKFLTTILANTNHTFYNQATQLQQELSQ